jgi:hypothetical protein
MKTSLGPARIALLVALPLACSGDRQMEEREVGLAGRAALRISISGNLRRSFRINSHAEHRWRRWSNPR